MRRKALSDAEIATLYQRLAAHFIDSCIMVAVMLAFVIFAGMMEGVNRYLAEGLRILGALLALAYRLLADGIMRGQGIGKRRMGIHVVAVSTGKPCGKWQSLVRALPIFVPVIGLVDVMVLLVTKRSRLGDFLARTRVVEGAPLPARLGKGARKRASLAR